MTDQEKALTYFKDLRARRFKDYSSVFDTAPKDSVVYKTVSAEIELYDTTIKALEQTELNPSYNSVKSELELQPRNCKTCIHSEERDGSNCYECVKNMADNFEAQPKDKCKGCYYNDGEAHAECVVCDKKAQPTDADCISREAMLSLQTEYAEKMGATTFWKLRDDIRALPPVTPQRPKGKWNFIGDQMFECSSCKRTYTQNQFEELRIYTTDDLLPKFCPNCGSYNGGGEDEEKVSD